MYICNVRLAIWFWSPLDLFSRQMCRNLLCLTTSNVSHSLRGKKNSASLPLSPGSFFINLRWQKCLSTVLVWIRNVTYGYTTPNMTDLIWMTSVPICMWIFGPWLVSLFGGGYGIFRIWNLAKGRVSLEEGSLELMASCPIFTSLSLLPTCGWDMISLLASTPSPPSWILTLWNCKPKTNSLPWVPSDFGVSSQEAEK